MNPLQRPILDPSPEDSHGSPQRGGDVIPSATAATGLRSNNAKQHRGSIPGNSRAGKGLSIDGGGPVRTAPPPTSKSYFNMAAGQVATWTVADQRRLISIDGLHTRVLEYHNNVHVRSVDEVLEQQYTELSVAVATAAQAHTHPFASSSVSQRFGPSSSLAGGGGGHGGGGGGGGVFVGGGGIDTTDPEAPSLRYRGAIMSTRLAAAFMSGSDIVAQILLVQPQATVAAPGLANGQGQPRPSQFAGSSPLHFASPTALSRERLGEALAAVDHIRASSSNNSSSNNSSSNNNGSSASSGSESLLWIHVADASILEELGRRYEVHDLVISGFSDLRAHSTFVPTPTGLLVSFCSFVMLGTDVYMTKVFVFLGRDNLVITHEREIHPDTSTEQGLVPKVVVVPKLIEKLGKASTATLLRLGPVYLLFLLAQTALSLQDSIIDFFSRTLYYFKHIVHTRLHHREKLRIHRKMHIVAVSIGMLQKSVELSIETFNTLLRVSTGSLTTMTRATAPQDGISQIDTPTLGRMLQGIIGEKHLPYLLDLSDAFKFANHCLTSEFEETLALDKAMDSITALRAMNTNTLLSLVATIFLPLNFLTGVFGTNFQTESGYTMTLLSDPHGPYFFGAICLGCIVVIVSYFAYNGWVEIRINSKRLCSCLMTSTGLVKPSQRALERQSRRGRDSAALFDDEDDEDEDEVLAEEERRKIESIHRRSAAGADPMRARDSLSLRK